MECPVCKTIASKEDQQKCAVCATDLGIFSLIDRIEKNSRRLKRTNALLIVTLIVLAAASVAYYYFDTDHDQTRQKSDMETIRQQQIEIQNLTNEKQVLMASMIELRKEIQQLNNKIEEMTLQANAAQTTPTPVFREIIHVVRRGESLQRIALKYYGNGDEYKRIMRDNNIRNANHIKVNQRLKIIVPVTD
jgi:nucleoid-associated protein YgaU